jgi:hypothetical protein
MTQNLINVIKVNTNIYYIIRINKFKRGGVNLNIKKGTNLVIGRIILIIKILLILVSIKLLLLQSWEYLESSASPIHILMFGTLVIFLVTNINFSNFKRLSKFLEKIGFDIVKIYLECIFLFSIIVNKSLVGAILLLRIEINMILDCFNVTKNIETKLEKRKESEPNRNWITGFILASISILLASFILARSNLSKEDLINIVYYYLIVTLVISITKLFLKQWKKNKSI